MLLFSKLYFNKVEKSGDCSKTYYVDKLIECLKYTFQKNYSDSSHQAIDETMVKFKGRSTLKQYLPLKPIKRGIKLWTRADSFTGFIYDFNVYAGKESGAVEGTLGERVVTKLLSTIRVYEVAFCFDRYFTSVKLMDTIKIPAVGTFIKNRKNFPPFGKNKMVRGEVEHLKNNHNTLAARWQDTKEVLALSNCHEAVSYQIKRKMKSGEKVAVNCPDLISFYNKFMGGVDLADQKMAVYDLDRKSLKWWKKVFFKLLFAAISNASIIHGHLQKRKKSLTMKAFLIALAEQLIEEGTKDSYKKKRLPLAVPGKRRMIDVGSHLPIEGEVRRRCRLCAEKKKERKIKLYCSQCKINLCKTCFTPYHLKL